VLIVYDSIRSGKRAKSSATASHKQLAPDGKLNFNVWSVSALMTQRDDMPHMAASTSWKLRLRKKKRKRGGMR